MLLFLWKATICEYEFACKFRDSHVFDCGKSAGIMPANVTILRSDDVKRRLYNTWDKHTSFLCEKNTHQQKKALIHSFDSSTDDENWHLQKKYLTHAKCSTSTYLLHLENTNSFLLLFSIVYPSKLSAATRPFKVHPLKGSCYSYVECGIRDAWFLFVFSSLKQSLLPRFYFLIQQRKSP